MNDEFSKLLDAIIALRDQYVKDDVLYKDVKIEVLGKVFTRALHTKNIPRCFQIVHSKPIDVNILIEPVTKLYELLSVHIFVISCKENELVNGSHISYVVFEAEP